MSVVYKIRFLRGSYMKELYIALAVLFIIITFGFVDIGMKFSDGTAFNYKGWNHLFFE